MIIGVAGPYTADTELKKKANLDAMNTAAARLLEIGHIPIIGSDKTQRTSCLLQY